MPAYPDGFGGNPMEKVAVEELDWTCSKSGAKLLKFADDLYPLKSEPGADEPARFSMKAGAPAAEPRLIGTTAKRDNQ